MANGPRTAWDWAKRILAIVLQLAGTFAGWLTASLPVPEEIAHTRYVVVGGLILAWIVMNTAPHARRWWLAGIATGLGVVLGVAFVAGSPSWIHVSSGQRYFRGELTPTAEQYLRDHPGVTEDEYFISSGRDPALVWTANSRWWSYVIVVVLYSLAVFFFTFGVFGALELFGQSPPPGPPGGPGGGGSGGGS
jgi:hypothetical protein